LGSIRTHRKSDPSSYEKQGRPSRLPVWVGCTTAEGAGSIDEQAKLLSGFAKNLDVLVERFNV
jgi:hypothetical protein